MSEDTSRPRVAGMTRTVRVRLTFGLLSLSAVLVLNDLSAAVGTLILGYLVETER